MQMTRYVRRPRVRSDGGRIRKARAQDAFSGTDREGASITERICVAYDWNGIRTTSDAIRAWSRACTTHPFHPLAEQGSGFLLQTSHPSGNHPFTNPSLSVSLTMTRIRPSRKKPRARFHRSLCCILFRIALTFLVSGESLSREYPRTLFKAPLRHVHRRFRFLFSPASFVTSSRSERNTCDFSRIVLKYITSQV